MSTTLTADVLRVTYENEETSFRVVKANCERKGPLTLVGTFPAVGSGVRVRVTGRFVTDPRHGEQFKVETLIPLDPKTTEGIERYLASGIVAGIGPGFAKRIVGKFGARTLEILDQDPKQLHRVQGLGSKRVEKLTQQWAEQRAFSSVALLLQTHGAPAYLAKHILKRYGEHAARIVQRSPYRLALEVRGIGFKTADGIARAMGLSMDHPERVQAGVVQQLETLAESGHVLCPRSELVTRAGGMLEVDEGHVDSAIDALWAAERVVIEDDLVYLRKFFDAERGSVESIVALLEAPAHSLPGVAQSIERFESEQGIELADLQRAAVEQAAREKVSVVTGGPGVGKTTIVRAILMVLRQAGLTVGLAAPTGRAAKRMTEATGQSASTIHRLLEYDARLRGFSRHAERPLDLDALIVDESSMIDIGLAHALLSAMPPAARLVIVGDADQLPSVGPGAVLRDLIASRSLPTVSLNEVFRQVESSGIVRNAHRILCGEPPQAADPDAPGADFFVIQRSDPEDAARTVRELAVERIPKRFGFHPRDDIQVLCPMHRGAAGTAALNELLQASLNPDGESLQRRGQTYRAGDKVMQMRNDYDKDVFNGDIGFVTRVDVERRSLMVRMDQRSLTYEEADLDNLSVAYATSVHKSQGSEYPAVVTLLLTAHYPILSRNLLYTAVTRARQLCVLVADRRALKLALSELRKEERATRLAERLSRALDERA